MAGSLDLGELYAKLSVDYSELHKAEAGIKNLLGSSKSAFDSIAKHGKQVADVGKKLTAFVTLPIAGIGAASFQAARDFSNAFSDVEKNISDLNSSNLASFKNEILELGRNSVLGAEGIAALVSEGGKLGEASKGAIEFAKAAEMMAIAFDFGKTKEAAEAAGDVIGSIRSQFGYTTKEVLKLGDSINYFADQTAASAKGIIKIINSQGSVVKGVTSLTDAELTALAATFESISPSVEIAATSMKNFTIALTNGAAATDEQKAVFKSLGLDAEQMAKIMSTDAKKGIATILKSLSGLEKYKKSAAISTLFGKESIGSIMPLIENMKALEENFKKAGNGANSLKNEYDRLNQSDDAKITKAMNALNVVMIQIGAQILPIVGELATQFSAWITSLGPLEPELIKTGIALGAVAAALGPVLLAVGSAVAAIAPMIASAGGLSAALGSLAAMAGPVGLAIAAIGAAGYLLYKNWEQVKSFIGGIINSIVAFFENWVSRNQGLIDGIKEAWATFMESAGPLWETLKNFVVQSGIEIAAALDSMLEPIGGLSGAWQLMKDGASQALTWIGEGIKGLLGIATTVFDSLRVLLDGSLWEYYAEIVNKTIEDVKKYLNDIKLNFKATFDQIANDLKNTNWTQIGKDIMIGLANGIKAMAMMPVDAAKAAGDAIIQAAKGVFDSHSPSKVFMAMGKDLMDGLGIGITQNGHIPKEALTKAVSDMNQSMTLNPTFGAGVGGDMSKYDFEIEKEKAYYEQSLALLQQAEANKIASIRPYADLREQMEQEHQMKLASFEQARFNSQLDAASGFFGNLAKLQNSENKKMAAIGKAAAIAQATIDTYKAATGAYAAMSSIPYVGPALGIAAAAAAVVAGMANVNAIRSQKAYNNGGYIPSNAIGEVGEIRGELVSGPANVMSAQKTHELLTGGSGGGSTNIIVEVFNYGGASVQVEQSGGEDEKRLRILIDKTKQSIAADMKRGDGPVDRAMQDVFKLNRSA